MADPVYADTTDFTRLGLPAAALTGVTTTAQTAALAAASRTADSYLRGRFRLPLTSWGDDLKRAVCAIAAWDVLTTRGFSPEGDGPDAAVRMRYDDALRWLKDVASELVTPNVVDSSSGGVSLSPRVGSRSPRGW